ncbi:MAG: mechanosensitive ion channel family protein [Firmicutes bacterium]|nr:mechanosensitive ion channel family protein [Bacillota bacterium]
MANEPKKKAAAPKKSAPKKPKPKPQPVIFNKLVDLSSPKQGKTEPMTKSAQEYENKKRASKVKGIIIFISVCAVALVVFILAISAKAVFGAGSDITAFIDKHIFNEGNEGNPIISSIIVLVLGYIAVTLLQFIIKLFAIKGSKRRKTIVSLFVSLAKYIGYVIVVIMLLNTWHVDPTIIAALIAALGIALGFGAQGLIGDLLSGLFLIFEDSIKVGDYVTFEDYRGEVVDVGIRTTRIKSPLGDVKVINNSELKSFVNMSMHRSMAICDVTIEYGENIERVEKVINANLLNIADAIPAVNDGPWYKGVQEFSERGVVLRITAKCNEEDRYQVIRDMNREVKRIFDKNNIKIALRKIELFDKK